MDGLEKVKKKRRTNEKKENAVKEKCAMELLDNVVLVLLGRAV